MNVPFDEVDEVDEVDLADSRRDADRHRPVPGRVESGIKPDQNVVRSGRRAHRIRVPGNPAGNRSPAHQPEEWTGRRLRRHPGRDGTPAAAREPVT
ncbi:hypothetical protein GCM10017687_71910 [Streptomyces echinatus]